MSLGELPGISTKLRIIAVTSTAVTFAPFDTEDVKYFKVDDDYMGQFHPVASGDRAGDEKK